MSRTRFHRVNVSVSEAHVIWWDAPESGRDDRFVDRMTLCDACRSDFGPAGSAGDGLHKLAMAMLGERLRETGL